MNGNDAKEVDDLSDHYQWMVGRARMRVSAADADDVANKALYDAHHPTGNRPPASEVPRVKLWLDELIDQRVRAHRKTAKKRQGEVLSDEVHLLVPNSVDNNVELHYADREWLRIALDSLPQDRRDLIVQCYVEEIPIEEVARSLGEKTNTIHTRLRRIRADLRLTLDKLLRISRRGSSLVFPFFFLRWFWKRITAPTIEACVRGIRHTAEGAVVVPGPSALGVAAAVLVLGFAPADPRATASEVLPDATNYRDVVVQSVNREQVTPGAEVVTPSKRTVAMVPAPVTAGKSARPSSTQSVAFDEQGNQLGLLFEAKAALNKRNYEKALALIAAHEAKYPDSHHASKREALRAIATKALLVGVR